AKMAVDPKAAAELVPRPAQAASAVFKDAGHAILRTAGQAGLSGGFTFGPYGGFHGHLDKLSFVFYGFGEELGVDPGRAKSQAYRLPIHTHWYKNTLGHNAVVVGGKPQIGVAGKLELFTANEQFAAVRASCDKAYPGVAQTRLLVMTPEYLLVFDTNAMENTLNGAPVANHARFDWIYHGKGKAAECDLAKAAGKLPDNTDGVEYIQNVKTGSPERPDQAVQARIVGEKITTWLTFDAQPNTTVYTGDGPFSNVDERVPLVIVERNTGTFAAVLEPVKNGDKPTVKAVSQLVPKGGGPADRGATGGRTIVIEREGGKDVIEVSADNKTFTLTRDGDKVLALP
ncbi:MAG TPA: heparinase II/III family protein, partial [Planctomycetota bacterium]|nr:heparinase II/III family protein [Planctomycetota bacterium]